jgi:adhesin HecA-like repeat protein
VTTTFTFATQDGYLNALSTNYATAKSGAGAAAVTTDTFLLAGQTLVGSEYKVYQTFIYWPFTQPTDVVVGAAMMVLQNDSSPGTGVPRVYGANLYDWTPGGLTGADWRNVYSETLGDVRNAQNWTTGKYAFFGSEYLRDRVQNQNNISANLITDRQRNALTPIGGEENNAKSIETSGTTSDPLLVFSTFPRCTLGGSVHAQVRLVSGGWAGVEMVNGITPRLVYISPTGVPTTIADLPIGTSSTDYAVAPALQAFALISDAADNLYVLGKAGGQSNQLHAACWAKGVGATWTTPSTWRRIALPDAGGAHMNQVAGAYVPVRTGVLFLLVGHHVGHAWDTTVGDLAFLQVDTDWIRGLSGTSNLAVADTTDILAPPMSGASNRFNAFTNETGSVLDVVRPAAASRSVYALTTGRNGNLSDNRDTWLSRAVVGETAGSLASTTYQSSDTWSVKDSGARTRVLPINATTVAVVGADADTGYGLTIRVWQSPTGTSWTFLGGAFLDTEGITNMPTPAALSRAPIWDALYNSGANKVYVYFVDSTDARTVRRTSFSVDSLLSLKDSTVVTSAVGPVGGSILALRADAHDPATLNALLTVAHNNSGVNYLTNYVVDSFNLPPNAPILTPHANYDATTGTPFAWTFSDPNGGDAQTAYDFQILDTAAGTLTVNTGWVVSATSSRNVTASTLTNGKNYQWRVRTRDSASQDGPWSGYGSFSTSAGGTVTITSPAVDNPPGQITDDVTITWSVAGTTQASYRVIVGGLVDTGWVTSTATSYLLTGMLSGVEYTVQVQVRNAALVPSGFGLRKVTAVYDSPEVPTITVSAVPAEGYVLVTVNNPIPQGDRPDASTNLVLRRALGETAWIQVGTAPPDGQFRDYTAGAWRTWEYKVRAVA